MSRKEQIINALIAKFGEEGFNIDFTMSSLAKDVNIGKSTIYEYFSNKDELLKEALLTYINNIIIDVDVMKDIEDFTFEETFKAQLKALFEAGYKSRTIMDTFSPAFMKSLPDEVRKEIKGKAELSRTLMTNRFTVLIEKGIKEGVLELTNAVQNAFVVRSLIVGSIMNFTNPEVEYDTDQAVDDVYDAMLKLLK
jgi:AcrR family transcriptional regulator